MFMSKRPIDTWGLLETFIDDALDGFYGYMDSDDDLSPFMDGRNIGRLKKTQRDHWQATFKDGYNNAYYERLHRIGTAHARIGSRRIISCAGIEFCWTASITWEHKKAGSVVAKCTRLPAS